MDAQATGSGGQLDLTVFRASLPGQTNIYTVTIDEMGTRNEATTPYNCPWVDGVLSNFCEYMYNLNDILCRNIRNEGVFMISLILSSEKRSSLKISFLLA